MGAKNRIILGIVLGVSLLLAGACVIGAAAPVKINFWGILRPNETDAHGMWLLDEIKIFEAANPGIKIEYNYTENEAYKTKLQVAMLGGAGPDVFFNWGAETQAVYSREGMLYDLTSAVGRDYWGLSKGLFATHTYNGKIYGIPFFPTVNTVWYNKKMFDQYGLKVPKTWDDFLNVCEKIKAKGVTPLAIGGKDAWTILHPFMYMADRVAGAKLYQEAKAGKASFAHADFVKAFTMLETLSKKGYLPADVLNMNYGDANQMMMQDKAAMMSMGNWQFNILTNESTSDFDKWDFFTFPVVPGGKGDAKSILGAADGFSINNSCRNPEAAVKFLKHLASKESLTRSFKRANVLASLATPYMDATAPPQMRKVADLLANATSLTGWWDQDLPAPMTQALLQGLQEILGHVKSPQAVAAAIEAARPKK